MAEPVLAAEDLTIQYTTDRGSVTAVSDASFAIGEAEYFGLVGESGCGKSTIAQAMIGGLDANGEVTAGRITYRGREIQDLSQQALNEEIRWKEISFIPQSAMNSLDPLLRIQSQAIKLARIHTEMSEAEAVERLAEMFEIVGLQRSRIKDYPHQFSGGMQQRAIIALALFLEPSVIIADEPTTALDVIMQDQVFGYLDTVKEELEFSMLLITHNISLVIENCDEMAIMHSGQVAERGPIPALLTDPRHPYAILLQEAFPDLSRLDRELRTIEGSPPQSFGDVDYCTFVDRCPWAIEECREAAPPLERVEGSDPAHVAACIRSEEVHELYAAERGVEAGRGGGD